MDADVKRPLASVSANVDGENMVVFGQQESDIGNESTGQRIPMIQRKGVFVLQFERSDWIEGEGEDVGFEEADVTRDVREFRERCKTKVTYDGREQGSEARIDGADGTRGGVWRAGTQQANTMLRT